MDDLLYIRIKRPVDMVRDAWKDGFGIEKSKTECRRALEQKTIKWNDRIVYKDSLYVHIDGRWYLLDPEESAKLLQYKIAEHDAETFDDSLLI